MATAQDGAEAIRMVAEKHYDIIFLDVRLPDMNGVETFERVKEIDAEVAVIMMTGYSENELMARAISQGAYTCIQKPFNLEKVIMLVENIARERKR